MLLINTLHSKSAMHGSANRSESSSSARKKAIQNCNYCVNLKTHAKHDELNRLNG